MTVWGGVTGRWVDNAEEKERERERERSSEGDHNREKREIKQKLLQLSVPDISRRRYGWMAEVCRWSYVGVIYGEGRGERKRGTWQGER